MSFRSFAVFLSLIGMNFGIIALGSASGQTTEGGETQPSNDRFSAQSIRDSLIRVSPKLSSGEIFNLYPNQAATISFGGSISIPLEDFKYLQPEILFTVVESGGQGSRTTLYFAELPLLYKQSYSFIFQDQRVINLIPTNGVSFSILAGIVPSVPLAAYFNSRPDEALINTAHKIAVRGLFGFSFGYIFGKHTLGFDLRYQKHFTSIFNSSIPPFSPALPSALTIGVSFTL